MASSAGDLMYAIRDIPGKGKGLIATRKIVKGTRILAEEPIVKAPRPKDLIPGTAFTYAALRLIKDQLKVLDQEKRRAFLALHNAFADFPVSKYYGIIRTNGLGIDNSGATQYTFSNDSSKKHQNVGIFIDASRMNHDCKPNSYSSWNELIQCYTVHAVRDIADGEEITINYLRHALFDRNTRRELLKVWCGFDCNCCLCTLPPDENHAYERTLEVIRKIGDSADNQIGTTLFLVHITAIEMAGRPPTPGEPDPDFEALSRELAPLLKGIRHEVRFHSIHGADAGLPTSFEVAALLLLSTGDYARSKVMSQRAERIWKIMEGDDGPNFLRTAAEAQREIKVGFLQEQKSMVHDIPQGLDEAAFEDWLWHRFGESTGSEKPAKKMESSGSGKQDCPANEKEYPSGAGSLANLRNRWTFPNIDELPDGSERSLNFYKLSELGYTPRYIPRRHWCFLGEIIENTHGPLKVRDVVGKSIPLNISKTTPGTELDLSHAQRGHTVAVLYAYQINMNFFSLPRIQLDNLERLKIIPTSLDNLLALSDRVQEFSNEANGMHRCHGCGKDDTSLKKCVKCSMFWYCGRDCQVKGWKAQGHMADCKLLRDNDLKGMFDMDWKTFKSFTSFPLDPQAALRSV